MYLYIEKCNQQNSSQFETNDKNQMGGVGVDANQIIQKTFKERIIIKQNLNLHTHTPQSTYST